MTIKIQSLGSVNGAIGRGLVISTATNATPIVGTFGGGPSANTDHRLKPLDRVAVFGITGNTNANGIWTLRGVEYATNTAILVGSRGNGAATVTNSVVAICMDRSPFMKGHSAVVIHRTRLTAAAFSGTVRVMGNDETLATGTDQTILASDSTTLATYFVAAPISTGLIEGPAIAATGATAGMGEMREIKLRKFIYLECSAWTAGGNAADIIS